MKKSLVALATLAATSVFAQTTTGQPGVQITGNLNAGFVSQNYYGNKVSGFEQNGMGTSNLFFRGLEDLGGGLKAYFLHGTDIQFMTLNGDRGAMYSASNAGAVGTFGNDQKLVGISGSFGAINFGTINNQSLYNGVVLLNPVSGTSYSAGYGSVNCADPTCSVVRYDNVMEYKSPVMSGFQAFVQTSNKQNKAVNTNYATTLGTLNMPSMRELSLKYSNGPITGAVTRLQTDATDVATASTAATKKTLTTFVGAYDLGNGLRLSALLQNNDSPATTTAASKDLTTKQIQALYTVGANTFGLNFGSATENNTARTTYGGLQSKFTGLQYKYALSKMTAFEAKYETLDDKAGLVTMPAQFGTTRISDTRSRSTIGLNMSF